MGQQLEKREPGILSKFKGLRQKSYVPGTAQGPVQLKWTELERAWYKERSGNNGNLDVVRPPITSSQAFTCSETGR